MSLLHDFAEEEPILVLVNENRRRALEVHGTTKTAFRGCLVGIQLERSLIKCLRNTVVSQLYPSLGSS